MKIFNVFPTRLRNLSCISPIEILWIRQSQSPPHEARARSGSERLTVFGDQ
jgi:hypothetical protein